MAGAASKNKGKSGERELCKIMENTFGGSFIRVPNSGAYVGGRNSSRKEFLSNGQIKITKGDIITPDNMPKFVLESKFYKDFPFHALLGQEPIPILESWIDQTIDCIDEDDFWMVCFKINRKGWFGCIEDKYASTFTWRNFCRYNERYFVFELKPFLEINSDKIKELSS